MLVIGDNNVFREFSTVNIATSKGTKQTVMGNNNYMMSYTHVGHDSIIGNNVVIANDSHIGGHCVIEDFVTIGGVCAFNQYVRVGKHAFIAGSSVVNKDILPFSKAQGTYAVVRATNKIGMQRKGFTLEEAQNMHKAIRIIIMGSDTIEQGIERIRQECTPCPHVDYFINFNNCTMNR
jgi:UDP-N-acetylglucosamine acyltransferase